VRLRQENAKEKEEMTIEVAVRIANEDQTYTQKFLLQEVEAFSISKEDPELQKMVNETIQNFKGPVDDILVKIKFTW
jgi:hypothetical protein